jgi:hypothetical protein
MQFEEVEISIEKNICHELKLIGAVIESRTLD